MNIKLFGYSISLNVLILIGILYLIMVVNALSSSCNREGFAFKNKVKSSNNTTDNTDKTAAQAQLNALKSIYASSTTDAQKQDTLDQMIQLQTTATNNGYSLS